MFERKRVLTLALNECGVEPPSCGGVPTGGCVPNAETAIRIAEAVWSPIFGDEIVKRQQ